MSHIGSDRTLPKQPSARKGHGGVDASLGSGGAGGGHRAFKQKSSICKWAHGQGKAPLCGASPITLCIGGLRDAG